MMPSGATASITNPFPILSMPCAWSEFAYIHFSLLPLFYSVIHRQKSLCCVQGGKVFLYDRRHPVAFDDRTYFQGQNPLVKRSPTQATFNSWMPRQRPRTGIFFCRHALIRGIIVLSRAASCLVPPHSVSRHTPKASHYLDFQSKVDRLYNASSLVQGSYPELLE